MNFTQEDVRKIALTVIDELGEKASPNLVKAVLEKTLEKMENESTLPSAFKKTEEEGRAILTAFGLNKPGILSKITAILSTNNIDIEDLSQKIMQDFFTVIMIINISTSDKDLRYIQDVLTETAKEIGIKIYVQHEDVFKFMHRI